MTSLFVRTYVDRSLVQQPKHSKLTITSQCCMIGCLTWLSTSTRPDIATATNLLAQFTSRPTHQHINAGKHIFRYLKGTKDMGISFDSRASSTLQSFVKFPLDPSTLTAFADANWGPQEQAVPPPNSKKKFDY